MTTKRPDSESNPEPEWYNLITLLANILKIKKINVLKFLKILVLDEQKSKNSTRLI